MEPNKMKTHLYKCTDCGTQFTIGARATDGSDVKPQHVSWCPLCECPLTLVPHDPPTFEETQADAH